MKTLAKALGLQHGNAAAADDARRSSRRDWSIVDVIHLLATRGLGSNLQLPAPPISSTSPAPRPIERGYQPPIPDQILPFFRALDPRGARLRYPRDTLPQRHPDRAGGRGTVQASWWRRSFSIRRASWWCRSPSSRRQRPRIRLPRTDFVAPNLITTEEAQQAFDRLGGGRA